MSETGAQNYIFSLEDISIEIKGEIPLKVSLNVKKGDFIIPPYKSLVSFGQVILREFQKSESICVNAKLLDSFERYFKLATGFCLP